MRTRLSRRDVLKGSGALALGLSSTTKVLSAAPPASAVTPELIAAAKKEGKVVYYTSIDLPLAEKIAKSFEAKYPGHRRARRAHRRRARVPAHRPGICEPHLRRRCGELVRRRALHRLEARRAPGALRAGGRRAALSGRPQGRRWPVRELPRGLERHRLQHRSGEAGGSRRRASPICSIRNGRARSSRRIRATAAPS